MSKVKAPLTEAREFAASGSSPAGSPATAEKVGPQLSASSPTAAHADGTGGAAAVDNGALVVTNPASSPPDLPDEGHVAVRDATLINNDADGGEPIAYSCEQEVVNRSLREAVVTLEKDSLQGALRLKEIFELAYNNFNEGVKPRHKAVTDYKTMFQWPPVPIGTPKQVLFSGPDDAKLPKYPIDTVYTKCDKRKDSTRVVATGAAALEEAAFPVETRLRMYELKDAIKQPNVLLLDETVMGEITDEVLIKLREMAFTDVFAFLRQELAKRGHDIDHLRDRLEAVSEEKSNAAMIDDYKTIERCSYEEVNITEKMLEKMRQQIDEVFNANADIDAFVAGYEATRDANEVIFKRLQEDNDRSIRHLTRDMDTVAKKKEDKLAVEAEAIEDHKSFTTDNNQAIQAIHREQADNWKRILALVEVNVNLSRQREVLVNRHLEAHAKDCQRRAEVDAWLEGCEAYEAKCREARDVLDTTSRWIDKLRDFNNRMIDEIEAKTIHEEAFITRVQEQLEYLDIYRMYRGFSDDLIHRKEVRTTALQRLGRNLDLQIQEAQVTLDPNRKKYAEEKAAAEKEFEEAKKTVQSLLERATKEKKFWQPIEEQLEQAQIEFDPPDVKADKSRVERKAQIVSRIREFLATEQESVDRDALSLRKLNTTNALMAKSYEQRRAAQRAADGAMSESRSQRGGGQ